MPQETPMMIALAKDKKDAAHFRPNWPAARTAEIRSPLSTSSAKNTAADRGIRLTLDLGSRATKTQNCSIVSTMAANTSGALGLVMYLFA